MMVYHVDHLVWAMVKSFHSLKKKKEKKEKKKKKLPARRNVIYSRAWHAGEKMEAMLVRRRQFQPLTYAPTRSLIIVP